MWPNPKTVESVPLKNQLVTAQVCKVIDGDTFKALIKYGESYLKLSIRINGIDAPELKKHEQHKAAAIVRDYVAKLIADKEVSVCIRKWDKYGGRVVADVWIDGLKESLGTHLIQLNYVKSYDGKGSKKWAQHELAEIECVLNSA